jgi:predicted GH43/DUF377 family glycosyl hydrolase
MADAALRPFRRPLPRFTRHPANPVVAPRRDLPHECSACMNPFVLRRGNEYWLYYAGGCAQGARRICLATAPVADPAAWTRRGVVLDIGAPDTFDARWVVLPHVVQFGDRWHLYYTSNCGKGEGLSAFPGLGVAIGPDPLHFTRYAGNPVLPASHTEGAPDKLGMAGGSVIPVRLANGETEWRWYYTGCPTVGDDLFLHQQKVVCLAVSRDGLAWERRGGIMYRMADRDYVNVAAAGPVVWQDPDGLFRMVYSAIGTRWGYYSICYAESEDGLAWYRGERVGDDLVLEPTGAGWERQMVEYPAIIREGDRYRLFYCGNGYGSTGIGTALSEPSAE